MHGHVKRQKGKNYQKRSPFTRLSTDFWRREEKRAMQCVAVGAVRCGAAAAVKLSLPLWLSSAHMHNVIQLTLRPSLCRGNTQVPQR